MILRLALRSCVVMLTVWISMFIFQNSAFWCICTKGSWSQTQRLLSFWGNFLGVTASSLFCTWRAKNKLIWSLSPLKHWIVELTILSGLEPREKCEGKEFFPWKLFCMHIVWLTSLVLFLLSKPNWQQQKLHQEIEKSSLALEYLCTSGV